MRFLQQLWLVLFAALIMAAVHGGEACAGEEANCLACHGELVSGLKTHAAAYMGCSSCHAGIDAAKTPHKITNSMTRGLLAEPPRLCYSCHDEKSYTNKHEHPALERGCNSCHNPHASKNNKLLTKPVPELCTGCHDRAMFEKKVQHGPAASGLCLQCHKPHSSQHASLLVAPPIRLCGRCHAAVFADRHLVNSRDGKGHPLAERKGGGARSWFKDPTREGKRFCCVSCHDPHSADSKFAIRFPMKSPMEICSNCHTDRLK